MIDENDFFKYIATPAKVQEQDCFNFFNVDMHKKDFTHVADIDITRMLSGGTFLGIEAASIDDTIFNDAYTIYIKAPRTGDIVAIDITAERDVPEYDPDVIALFCNLTKANKGGGEHDGGGKAGTERI